MKEDYAVCIDKRQSPCCSRDAMVGPEIELFYSVKKPYGSREDLKDCFKKPSVKFTLFLLIAVLFKIYSLEY